MVGGRSGLLGARTRRLNGRVVRMLHACGLIHRLQFTGSRDVNDPTGTYRPNVVSPPSPQQTFFTRRHAVAAAGATHKDCILPLLDLSFQLSSL